MHEAMFSLTEAPFVVRRGRYYIILPTSGGWSRERYCAETGAEPIDRLFEYESSSNDEWLSVDTIRKSVFQEGGNAV
ncbi:MAG: hypothetical protein AAF724_02520 [Pseudomonadota bacterium]